MTLRRMRQFAFTSTILSRLQVNNAIDNLWDNIDILDATLPNEKLSYTIVRHYH